MCWKVAVHIGKKISAPSIPIENPAVRSSLQDARGSIQLGYDNGYEKSDVDRENQKLKKQLSNDEISLRTITNSQQNDDDSDTQDSDTTNRMSFADLKKQKAALGETKGINLVYMQHDKENAPSKSSFLSKTVGVNNTNGEKKTTFATLPNTTTWQQQSTNVQAVADNGNVTEGQTVTNHLMPSQLNDVRMKLEEKRRNIETTMRKVEFVKSKQRQTVGKAAFLQAVVKVCIFNPKGI